MIPYLICIYFILQEFWLGLNTEFKLTWLITIQYRIFPSHLPMDSGIMGFCGFGWMFSDSTTLRIRLCVFSERDEPFTCQPVRHFACTVASNSDRDWESSWSWASDSLTETAETSPLSGVAMSVVPLPLELLRLLRLLWYLYRSLVKLLGIITRQARGNGGHTKKKKCCSKTKRNRCRILLLWYVMPRETIELLKWM